MGFVRPATPGFLVCLAATALFAVVTFSVPYIKSIYFLKASFNQDNTAGSLTFGTLGYCLTLPNGTTCSKPSVGYQLGKSYLAAGCRPLILQQISTPFLATTPSYKFQTSWSNGSRMHSSST